jgi:hypothetical protein
MCPEASRKVNVRTCVEYAALRAPGLHVAPGRGDWTHGSQARQAGRERWCARLVARRRAMPDTGYRHPLWPLTAQHCPQGDHVMTEEPDTGVWRGSSDRVERVKEMSLSDAEFAALTGANAGFSPAHAKEWMIFWKSDICENDEFHTWFPRLSLAEARRVWMAMEEHYLANYDYFLRVWPEWYSSGIWAPPYPGSRAAGGMVDYRHLPLRADLVERFKAWQAEFDEGHPGDPVADPEGFTKRAEDLARDLRRCVGPRVYVEFRELIEVLPDGSTRSCRPVLALPDDTNP